MREALAVECEHFDRLVRGTAEPLTGGESGLRIVRQLECGEPLPRAGGGRGAAMSVPSPLAAFSRIADDVRLGRIR
jgi:hypothetical protein